MVIYVCSGVSAAVLSRSKGYGNYFCVCFLALMTWTADYTLAEVLDDAIKCTAASGLLPKGAMPDYSQEEWMIAQKHSRKCSNTVVEEFQRQTEGLYL